MKIVSVFFILLICITRLEAKERTNRVALPSPIYLDDSDVSPRLQHALLIATSRLRDIAPLAFAPKTASNILIIHVGYGGCGIAAIACAYQIRFKPTGELLMGSIYFSDEEEIWTDEALIVILKHEVSHLLGLVHSSGIMSPDTLHSLAYPYFNRDDEQWIKDNYGRK